MKNNEDQICLTFAVELEKPWAKCITTSPKLPCAKLFNPDVASLIKPIGLPRKSTDPSILAACPFSWSVKCWKEDMNLELETPENIMFAHHKNMERWRTENLVQTCNDYMNITTDQESNLLTLAISSITNSAVSNRCLFTYTCMLTGARSNWMNGKLIWCCLMAFNSGGRRDDVSTLSFRGAIEICKLSK